mmetsp:Transcript_38039/g.75423  ORF Transcript_38039/g.75423 Transcript_38039/m.75423 type:complete len:256 (-) Transcript_38039:461-1228(-)
MFIVAHHGAHGSKEEASADLALDDVTSSDAALEECCIWCDLRHALVAMWLCHGAVPARLLFVDIQHGQGSSVHIPIWVCEFLLLGLAVRNDSAHLRRANLSACHLTSSGVDCRRALHVLHDLLLEDLAVAHCIQAGALSLGQRHLSVLVHIPCIGSWPLRPVKHADNPVESDILRVKLWCRFVLGFVILKIILCGLNCLHNRNQRLCVLHLNLHFLKELAKRVAMNSRIFVCKSVIFDLFLYTFKHLLSLVIINV